MIDTSSYVTALFAYEGSGSLTTVENETYPGDFTAIQLPSGHVILLVELDHTAEGSPDSVSLFLEASRFTGTTSDSRSLTATGLTITNTLTPSDSEPYLPWDLHAYRVRELEVSGTTGITAPSAIRYGLTNFEFRGDPGRRNISRGQECLGISLRYGGRLREIDLRSVPDHRDVVKRLKTMRGVEVTAEIVLDPGDFVAEEDERQFMNALTYVLSVARGTKVQWIYRTEVSDGQDADSILHRTRVTKPFTGQAPIRPDRMDALRQFLDDAMSSYEDLRTVYNLEGGTIDAYLDARLEEDYLETRAAKLAVALEALKHVFAEEQEDESVETFISPEDFKVLSPKIADCIEELLSMEGVEQEERQGMTHPARIRGLNRRSFRSLINKLSKSLDLNLEYEETALFVKCRNSLVHSGRFYCDRAPTSEVEELPWGEDRYGEYLFMTQFLERLLLGLLGYSGTYYDRRAFPEKKEISIRESLV